MRGFWSTRRRVLFLMAVLMAGLGGSLRCAAQAPAAAPGATNAVQAEMEAATHQVEAIVNQPVTAYRRAPGMKVSRFSPGWFHPGASKPDFNNVDIRTTQETPYAAYPYVTSDLNLGVVFPGAQLEFNSMTKYFYTNRNLPKKKLTEAEMLEINRLYRIIGRCEQQLAPKNPEGAPRADSSETGASAESGSAPARRPRLLNPYIGAGGIALLLLIVLVTRRGK